MSSLAISRIWGCIMQKCDIQGRLDNAVNMRIKKMCNKLTSMWVKFL